MKRKDERRAFALAAGMAIELDARMPCRCTPPDVLLAVVWPLACRVAVAERKAARNAKAARRYWKLRREVDAVMALPEVREDGPVPLGRLLGTVALDARLWHGELAPGAPAVSREREAA